MRYNGNQNTDWLDRYKKKIILSIVSILTLTIVVTMLLISFTMRSRLLQEGRVRAEELGTVILSSLEHLMQERNPGRMQSTLVAIGREDTPLVKVFIVDNRGKVAYSSRVKDIGVTIDRFTDVSCRGCHSGPTAVPNEAATGIMLDGKRVLRYVRIIQNGPTCYQCHPASQPINGKLIIDWSLEPTYALVSALILIIIGAGLAGLIIFVPVLWRILSRGVDTYIAEIRMKSTELAVLYNIVERLSTTIELEELKRIIVDIVGDSLGADEIDMVLPNEYRELGAIVWTKSGTEIVRKKVENGTSLAEIIRVWSEGRIPDHAVVNDGKEIHMPVTKGEERLALIVVRFAEGGFDVHQLTLVRAMANHIAVAFENALLYHIAITDELTGLFTSRHFRQAIAKKYSHYHEFGEKMTLLMIDIDNFKRVNDTYGHPAGDVILKDVGRCIMSSIRDDDMGFRYGGEEFAVILPVTDVEAGKRVANRMRKLIENYPFRVDQHVLQVTVSIGVASWPKSADTIKEIITEADKSLYEAKDEGRNRVVVRTR